MLRCSFFRLRLALGVLAAAVLPQRMVLAQQPTGAPAVKLVRGMLHMQESDAAPVDSLAVFSVEQSKGVLRFQLDASDAPVVMSTIMRGRENAFTLSLDVQRDGQADVYKMALGRGRISNAQLAEVKDSPPVLVIDVETQLFAHSRSSGPALVDVTYGSPLKVAHVTVPLFPPAPSSPREGVAVCATISVRNALRTTTSEGSGCPPNSLPVDGVFFNMQSPASTQTGLPSGKLLTQLTVHAGAPLLRKLLDELRQQCELFDVQLRVVQLGKTLSSATLLRGIAQTMERPETYSAGSSSAPPCNPGAPFPATGPVSYPISIKVTNSASELAIVNEKTGWIALINSRALR